MAEVIMGGFTKLFSRILTSSIWSESNEVRIVWITLLAATGPDGIARVTLPGLSRLSNIPLTDTEAAIKVLTSPDAYSRTVEHDGRRIREERDSAGNLVGFFVFNYSKHRALDATAAQRQRERRARVTRDRHARQKTEDRSKKTEGRKEDTEPPALPPADSVQRRINESEEFLRTKLYTLIAKMEGLDPEHRDPSELMRLVTSYERKDGQPARGVVNAALLTYERLEKSIGDAEHWIGVWGHAVIDS